MLYNNNNGKGLTYLNLFIDTDLYVYLQYSVLIHTPPLPHQWLPTQIHKNDFCLWSSLPLRGVCIMQVILFGGRGGLTSRKINMSRVFSIITGINHFKTKAHHLGVTFLNCIALKVFKPFVDSQRTITVHRCNSQTYKLSKRRIHQVCTCLLNSLVRDWDVGILYKILKLYSYLNTDFTTT